MVRSSIISCAGAVVYRYNFQYYPVPVQRAFFDRAAAAGFKVMLQVSQGWIKRNNADLDRDTLAKELDALTANITAVMDHPALLGYYICDDCCSSGQIINAFKLGELFVKRGLLFVCQVVVI